ncbi:hypothetical protein PFISCL1PPCAC_14151, partial [Pristionchus fissidentatus]
YSGAVSSQLTTCHRSSLRSFIRAHQREVKFRHHFEGYDSSHSRPPTLHNQPIDREKISEDPLITSTIESKRTNSTRGSE